MRDLPILKAFLIAFSQIDGDDYDETTIPYEFYGTEDTADTDEERYIKDVTKSIQRLGKQVRLSFSFSLIQIYDLFISSLLLYKRE